MYLREFRGKSKIFFGGLMLTLKRAIIILALFIPLLTLNTDTMLRGEFPLNKGGLRGLLFPSFAEAYTYQDVENAYNNAKTQYPNDYIWIEEFNQDGQKGYKIWRRPDASKILEGRYWYYTGSMFTASGVYLSQRHFCDGTDRRDRISFSPGATYLALDKAVIYEKYCDNTEKLVYSHDYDFGLNPLMLTANPCLWHVEKKYNCRILDTIVAEFFPIDECEDKDGDGYSTCAGDCNDNDSAINPGATEKCDGKDNNCNKDIDEGACDCSIELRLNSSANAANGNLSHNQELFSSKGTGLSTSISLYYNSLYSNSGHSGTGWSHSYDITLKEFADGSILFREGNDRRLYTLSNGSYVNQVGDYSTLIKTTDGSYLLTKKDELKYTFDTAGKLTKIEDRLANAMTFVYIGGDPSTGSGQRLTEITDSVGRKTTLSYDSNNRITQIKAPSTLWGEGGGEGRTSTLTYNSSGYLTSVTDSAGYSWTYTYNSDGRMLTKSDTEGNVITYTYDTEGRIISSTDSSGKSKTISYNPSPLGGEGGVRGTATVTERDGGVWTYTYDVTNGTLTQKTDPQGNTTTYQYDNNKNLTKETASDESITTYTYDTNGNMTGQTDASGNTTTYTYNDYGQTTSIKDPQNNVPTIPTIPTETSHQ